jgi:FhuF 2Fe-2S C-terminal domain
VQVSVPGPGLAADPAAVRAALAEAAAAGPFFTLSVGDDGRDWVPVGALYSAGLGELIAATGASLGVTEPRVAVATVHLGYAARLWSPVLHCALRQAVVPDLTGLRVGTAPSLRLNLRRPGGWQVSGPAAQAALAYRMVVGCHLEPLRAHLPVKVATGLLHGNAAAAMTSALRLLAAAHPELGPRARALAQTLLATGVLRGTGELTGPGLEFVRRSCCLFYRVPGGGTCADCPLPPALAAPDGAGLP